MKENPSRTWMRSGCSTYSARPIKAPAISFSVTGSLNWYRSKVASAAAPQLKSHFCIMTRSWRISRTDCTGWYASARSEPYISKVTRITAPATGDLPDFAKRYRPRCRNLEEIRDRTWQPADLIISDRECLIYSMYYRRFLDAIVHSSYL